MWSSLSVAAWFTPIIHSWAPIGQKRAMRNEWINVDSCRWYNNPSWCRALFINQNCVARIIAKIFFITCSLQNLQRHLIFPKVNCLHSKGLQHPNPPFQSTNQLLEKGVCATRFCPTAPAFQMAVWLINRQKSAWGRRTNNNHTREWVSWNAKFVVGMDTFG